MADDPVADDPVADDPGADDAVAGDTVAQRILACVQAIPPGRVMTYGDVAEYVGTRAPRQVGRVLALDGGTVPWHRVLRADGTPAEHLADEQRQRLIGEGVRFTRGRVDLSTYRWDGRSPSVGGEVGA